MPKLNRRDFLRMGTISVAGAALAGCCPAPAEKEVVVTQLVEKEGEPASADEELTVYMQMGGQQGDPSTLARTNGAKAAAEDLGIKLIEQYSGWDSQTMIEQFKEAIAAEHEKRSNT